MDDIRRPQSPERRDYAIPVRREPPRPAPVHHPQPQHHSPSQQIHATQHHPVTNVRPVQHDQSPQPEPAAAYDHHRAKKRNLKSLIIIALPLAAAAIFAAGYSLKSSPDQNTIPPSVTNQAKFSVYFPSPMPAGYIYMKNTATFQIGEVFYKFASGNKRVTVKEEPVPATKPDLNLLAGYTQFNSSLGPAAIGQTFGQPTAVIIAPTTVITMNSSGGVSQSELKDAINNLKNIGQNPGQKSSNG
jgi:hypothetical protein